MTAFNYLGSGHRCSPLVCLNDGLGDHSPPGGPTCPVLLVAFDRLFGATLHSPLKKKNPGESWQFDWPWPHVPLVTEDT